MTRHATWHGLGLGLVVALVFHAPLVTALSGGASCADDEGCQLNGQCGSDGVCVCASEWTGPDCSVLNLKPARPSPHAGYDEQGTSSWGGSIIEDPAGGLWHMYVSRMAGHCGLNAWQQNSELIHATSKDPVGPYVYNSTVLPHFAHGPSVRKTPDGYMMMHLGCGVPFVPYIKDCVNGSTPKGEGGPGGNGGNKCTQFNVSVMTSPAVSGPWGPSQPVHLSSGAQHPSWYVEAGGRQFSNPAPHVMRDGSLRCAFRADSRAGGEHVSIATAKGPLGPYVDARSAPAVHHPAEDPFLWQDERGYWHLLMHNMGEHGVVARHAFSRDGVANWTSSKLPPYSTLVAFSDGSTKQMTRRERPQLVLSERGQPRYFSSGVQDIADHTYTLVIAINAE